MDRTNQSHETKTGFTGEWLTYDGSKGIDDWLIWKFIVRGNTIYGSETSGQRRPIKGEITDEITAKVTFADDTTMRSVLIDDNLIEWNNDATNHWYRRNSSEDPIRKFEKDLKTADATGVSSIVESALRGDGDQRGNVRTVKGWKLKMVVEEWAKWIISNDPDKMNFVELTADKLRGSKDIVRFLVIQLTRTTEETDSAQKQENAGQKGTIAQGTTSKVHRRIAKLLAEMSDKKYFSSGDANENYKDVKEELKNHAVPVLVSRLPTETDLEIRRHFAVVLGELKTEESIDALVRTVVSDEQIRASRKEMLADYYLKPSRKQSEQAAGILEGAVDEAKKTLRLLQGLNVIVFIAGLVILVGGLFVSITNENSRIAGALAGIGGFAGVIGLLINDPLNRIQNSLSNLVQLESAFTSFIWELNLNSTYIQSQYVAEGILREEDVAETLIRIESAMDFAMNQVATYTDEGREKLVPHLTHLSPMVGGPGDLVQVYGNHIKMKGRTREDSDQVAVAINHVPIKDLDPPGRKNVVSFELPAEMPAGFKSSNGNVWISLVINGVETNALPFSVLKDDADS